MKFTSVKNLLFILVFALVTSTILIQCGSSVKSTDQTIFPDENNIEPLVNYTTSDLEGNWTLIKVETIEEKQSIARFKQQGGDPEIAREWSPPVYQRQFYFVSFLPAQLVLPLDTNR